jgi:hypothetical protein
MFICPNAIQIDALLPTVRPKYDSSSAANLEFVLRQLHDFILSMSPVLPLHPLEASAQLLKRTVAVPYCQPLPTEDTNWKVSFERPADIKLVGNWANKLSVKAKDAEKFCIDIGVEMPNVGCIPVVVFSSNYNYADSVPRERLLEWQILSQTSVLYCHNSCSFKREISCVPGLPVDI